MTDLRQKTVLITGAGGGFGLHMTRQFRNAGSCLLVTDLHDRALRAAVDESGDALIASVTADLSTEAGCAALVEACAARSVVPDLLVNYAGIAVAGRLDHVPGERWETLMQLNLMAPMRLCRYFLPYMIERQSGHIVNISSLAGWIGTQGLTSYCAAKFGLRGFGEALAGDLEEHNVKVTTVYPCFSRTPILDSEQFGYDQRRVVPEGMISEPADIVATIIKGVQRNKLHVFPDRYARTIHYLKRFAPWTIPFLNRRMDEQSIASGEGAS